MKKSVALVCLSLITPFLFSCNNADPHVVVSEEEFNHAVSLSDLTHLQVIKTTTISLTHGSEEMKRVQTSNIELSPKVNHNTSKIDGELANEFYYKLNENDPSKCDEAENDIELGEWKEFTDLDASTTFKKPSSYSPVNFYSDLNITFNPLLSYKTVSLKNNVYVYVGEIMLDGMKYPITLNLSFFDKVLLKYSSTYQMIIEGSYQYSIETIISLSYDTSINPVYPL